MSKLMQLADFGQAIWLDYIRRSFISSGELSRLVDNGVRGVTSNPSIFDQAISGSSDYDAELDDLVETGKSVKEIYESLAMKDIRRAAETLFPVYESTNGADGYVSLEVSPTLAHDTSGTLNEARRLFKEIDRPNVMIKIPATKAGISAIESAISEGINVNVTLIFSVDHYQQAARAYIGGLESLLESGGNLSGIASVASVFVSRLDTLLDKEFHALGESDLKGKLGVANAKLIYARFQDLFNGRRWERLASKGARVQRPLWASTGTKNPDYSDTLYVDNLIGPETVNTAPLATLEAFMDHGKVARTIDEGVETARAQISRLNELGIDLAAATQKLQEDGVGAFANSFESLLGSISEKSLSLSKAGA